MVQEKDASIIWAKVMPSECEVSLQLDDGRFLKVAPNVVHRELWTPTKHVLVATRDEFPGQEGTFIPVDISKRFKFDVHGYHISDGGEQFESKVLLHDRASADGVAFWNPKNKVFIRVNEKFEVDCSFECNMVKGEVYIPGGWSWEVFHLQFLSAEDTESIGIDQVTTTSTFDVVTSEDSEVRRRAPSITANPIAEFLSESMSSNSSQ